MENTTEGMTESNNWSGELEEIFRSHENRIEHELHKMSESFEMCTPHEDITFMSNFFDYLSYRLIATCKKIEVDYFAKKTEPNPMAHSSSASLDLLSPTTHNNASVEDLHGQWENDSLKIVEDYDSPSLIEFSDDTNSSTLVNTSSALTIANVKKEMVFPTSLETISSSDELVNMEQFVAKRHSDRQDIDHEQKKKYKNHVSSKWDSENEEGEIVEPKHPKNIDPNMYATNTDQTLKCALCNSLMTKIIAHYKEHHPESEVFIARPSPLMANAVRRRLETFTVSSSNPKAHISGLCFFCEKTQRMVMSDWKDHIMYHTGEMVFSHPSFGTFSKKPLEFELIGFMCKSCNYLQLNENNLQVHLMNEHEKSNEEIVNGYDKVILVPDLRPLESIQPSAVFVEECDRYACGIGWCDYKSKNITMFRAHLHESHTKLDRDTAFGCLHCRMHIKYIGKSFFRDIIRHLNLHSNHLCSCSFCDVVHSLDTNMMVHLMQQHPAEKIQFRYFYRLDWNGSSEVPEEFTIILHCNACTDTFSTITAAMNHIKCHHNSINIDFAASKLIKLTKIGAITNISRHKTPLAVRQYFECARCDEFRCNEYLLIKHFTNSHRIHPLILKPGEIFVKYTDDMDHTNEIVVKSIQNVFYCYHCYVMERRYVGSVDSQEIFSHWFTSHSRTKPFRFFHAEISKCAHCNLMGTYQALQLHTIDEHPNAPFAIVKVSGRNDECGLCQYSGPGLGEHFQKEHCLTDQVDHFCPVPLNDIKLKQLIELKGQKKRRCKHCTLVFETKQDMETHHSVKHPKLKLSSEKFYDNESIHLVTGCCQSRLNPNEFFNHLKQHKFQSKCNECSFETNDLLEIEMHRMNKHNNRRQSGMQYTEILMTQFWKTLVVFGNGLVLNKYNLIGTNHDDSQTFKLFLDDIVRDKELDFDI